MPNPFMSAPFRKFGSVSVATAGTVATAVALPRAAEQTVVISHNGTANPVFTRLCTASNGTASVTAGDSPVQPGQKRVFAVTEDITHIGLVANGTVTVSIEAGDGTVT